VPSLFARTILEPGDALDRATRLIKGRSNVIAVTLTTGGNDALAANRSTTAEIASLPLPGSSAFARQRISGRFGQL
jgi:hypothetical protein